MKKILSLSVFCLLLSTFSFAQLDNDQLLEDLLKMEQQLKQSLKGMGLDLDNPDMMDTLSLRGLKDLPIDIDGEMLQLFGQNMDMNLMMDMMMKDP